jgi:hypothetical protein
MLEGRADSVLAVIHDAEDESNALILDRERLSIPASDLLEVWDENGSLIWRSPNWSGAPAGVVAANSPTFDLAQGHVPYRGVVVHKATIFDEEDNHPGPPNNLYSHISLRTTTTIFPITSASRFRNCSLRWTPPG